MEFLTERNVEFKNLDQANLVLSLITDLANNTRLWSNNGYTPYELFNMQYNIEPPNMRRIMPIGRNEPCICGSGKKYKNCCFKSEYSH